MAPRILETIRQDTLYAARGMRKNPLFAAMAVLILAIGIGTDTAMFTVIRAVLLKPLTYRDPDSLVRISGGATPTRFEQIKAAARSLAGIGAYTGMESVSLSEGGQPETVKGVRVSADFLEILGVRPLLGRSFLPLEDSSAGQGVAPSVAMISAELWARRFGADPRIIGRTTNLSAAPVTIVGVLPPRFSFPFAGVDVWMTRPSEWPAMAPRSRALSPFLTVFGRILPGVGLDRANAEMAVIHRSYAVAHPAMLDAKSKSPIEVTPMKAQLVADVRGMLWVLFGAVSFVLLIACANVAGLMLARAAARSREFAIRAALGAGRSRIAGQLLAESVLLSLAGGAAGIMLAASILRAIPAMTALDLPRASEIHLDWSVLAFALTLSIATGLLFGLAPSLSASRPDPVRVLRGTGAAAGTGPSRHRVRSLLVVGQVALSVVLLIGAALLMQSVARLRGVDVGFNPSNLLTASVSLPLSRYDTDRKKAAFFRHLVDRVGASPGVRGVTAALFLPMLAFPGTPVQDASQPPLPLNQRPIAVISPVMPDYFRTLGIPLRRGRDFTQRDGADAPRVAIVNETLARRFWPSYPAGEDPVGHLLLVGGTNQPPARIVGIAADVRQNLENTAWPECVYVSFAQGIVSSSAVLAVRTGGNPLGFANTIRAQVRALDRDQPVSAVRTMDELVDEQVGQRRLIGLLLGAFAGMALLLALIGIYGVISYSVLQRVQELGIRWALGARPVDIMRLVIGQGLGLTIAGTMIGMAAALALTRVLKSLLFHVSATDPVTFGAIALMFIMVALAATWIPARGATRLDPMAALRI